MSVVKPKPDTSHSNSTSLGATVAGNPTPQVTLNHATALEKYKKKDSSK
ncbi:6382_t:CDS:1, partial [Acaulospora colombiana]